MPRHFETGNILPILSLGGVQSKNGQGRVVDSDDVTQAPGYPPFVIPSNPKRISLLIQNVGDVTNPTAAGATIDVSLGGLDTIAIVLGPLGTLQIDSNFPWTDSIVITSGNAAFSPVVNYVEIGLL